MQIGTFYKKSFSEEADPNSRNLGQTGVIRSVGKPQTGVILNEGEAAVEGSAVFIPD
ncbi:MAG TPA: hypothetical protein VFS41_01225 [Edaphobacter sp.]|nr:hypothetical protein [Edaphobacter sp.]